MSRHDQRREASRTRILDAAFELFRAQGMDATTIEDICERADVANRTFFNHFPRRDDMVRALAVERLRGLDALLAERRGNDRPAPALLVAFFDEVASYLETSGPFYRELVGSMLVLSAAGAPGPTGRSGDLHLSFLSLIKDGAARGEVTTRHDALTLTDIVVGTLVAVLMSWTADESYSIRSGLHDAAVALADLLAPS